MTKPMKPDAQLPSGRIAFNERGNAVWQWRTNNGTFKSDVDTTIVKALQEDAEVELREAPAPAPSHNPYSNAYDPYNSADAPRELEKKRRTPEDMRRLSEEIKRAREVKKPA